MDAWLNSGTVWSDKDSDLNQFLMFDLGKVMNVITITTKGRSHTNNYVSVCQLRVYYVSSSTGPTAGTLVTTRRWMAVQSCLMLTTTRKDT